MVRKSQDSVWIYLSTHELDKWTILAESEYYKTKPGNKSCCKEININLEQENLQKIMLLHL